MKKLIDEMLSTPAGREALLDAIPRLFDHNKQRRVEASIEDVPIDRIAWSAAHRLNSVPKDVVDKLQNPVELNRVSINGEILYLTANGNHRIERFVEAGRKTIPARVHDWDLASAVLKKGFTTEHRLDIKVADTDKGALPVPSDDITPAQAELFKALDLVKDETTPAPPPPPPRKRRILGFGIGD
jgi:uncharacterized ParB-like nuclease family protein